MAVKAAHVFVVLAVSAVLVKLYNEDDSQTAFFLLMLLSPLVSIWLRGDFD